MPRNKLIIQNNNNNKTRERERKSTFSVRLQFRVVVVVYNCINYCISRNSEITNEYDYSRIDF